MTDRICECGEPAILGEECCAICDAEARAEYEEDYAQLAKEGK